MTMTVERLLEVLKLATEGNSWEVTDEDEGSALRVISDFVDYRIWACAQDGTDGARRE